MPVGGYLPPWELNTETDKGKLVSVLKRIELGRWDIDVWYFSPYPAEYIEASCLYICEFSLKCKYLSASVSASSN
jgi:hypothetical protein